MNDSDGQSHTPAAASRLQGLAEQFSALGLTMETAVCFVFTTFFLFYGLVPIFGGDALGLVGADEPRYAQIAREMLRRHDYVTPILYGHPWLEKPALYYWRAMFSFREFGVHDWSARLPSASIAFTMVALIYLHMRRFRPGGQLDAALITASCAGIIAFARGASTDMQLAAPFAIGMLGWYAWYETDKKFWLFDLYFFNGAATLAKGPVAPFLALCIIFSFAALRREWSVLRRTIWLPGVALYLAMVLPWYIAVTRRNPEFLRIFFLEHNLQRFATNLYEHEQPIWFYLMVMLLALMPWTVVAMRALWDAGAESINEWRARRAKNRYVSHARWGDAFPEFLVLWTLFPVAFFSLSRSKLPGYILPAIPPLTILTADYLNRLRQDDKKIPGWLLTLHALLTGITVTLVVLLPWFISHVGGVPPWRLITTATLSGVVSATLIAAMVTRYGVQRLRAATLLPLAALLLFHFGSGPFFGLGAIANSKRTIQLIDRTYSARPLARQLYEMTPHEEPVAVLRVRRDMEYGLSFYRNERVLDYDRDGVPPEAHVLVVRDIYARELHDLLATRSYHPLFSYPAQRVSVYEVDALGTSDTPVGDLPVPKHR